MMKVSVAAPRRSPARLFHAKHPEDDMTELDIASPDAAKLEGAITGKALYDGRLDLATAIQMAGRA